MKPVDQHPSSQSPDGSTDKDLALANERSRTRLLLPVGLAVLFAGLYLTTGKRLTGHDDLHYANLAIRMAEGEWPLVKYQGPPVFPVRVGLLAPVALTVRLCGVSETSILLYPTLAAIVGILFAWLLLDELLGPTAATIGTALFGIIPIHFKYSVMLLPDLAAGAWTHLGLWLFLRATRSDHPTTEGWKWGTAAGLALGVSWLHKTSVTLMAPWLAVILMGTFWKRTTSRSAIVALIGAGMMVVAAEAVTYGLLTDDPLYRFHATSRNFSYNANLYWFVEGGRDGWSSGNYFGAVLERILVSGPRMFLAANVSIKLAVLAIFFSAFCRDRRAYWLAGWFLVSAAWLNFIPTSWSPYSPLVLKKRYLLPLFLPACGLAAWMTHRLATWPRFSIRVAAICLIPALITFQSSAGWVNQWQSDPLNDAYHGAVQMLRGDTELRSLSTDANTAGCLRILAPETSHRLRAFESTDLRVDTELVLLVPRRLKKLRHDYKVPLPDYLGQWPASVPDDWTLIRDWPAAQLYAIPPGRNSSAAQVMHH